jgi:hypothetical protein
MSADIERNWRRIEKVRIMMIARNQLATVMHSCCRQFIFASAFGFKAVWLVAVAAGQASSNLPMALQTLFLARLHEPGEKMN